MVFNAILIENRETYSFEAILTDYSDTPKGWEEDDFFLFGINKETLDHCVSTGTALESGDFVSSYEILED